MKPWMLLKRCSLVYNASLHLTYPMNGDKERCVSSASRNRRGAMLLTCITCLLAVAAQAVDADSATNSATNSTSKAVAVVAKPVAKLAFFPAYRAAAKVVALNESRISAQISAVIRDIPVRVGDEVKKGGLLVQLDCHDYELVLQRQQAQGKSVAAKRSLAKYQLTRAQKLTTQQAVAEELLKQRETDVAVLQAEVKSQNAAIKQAQRNVDYCAVRAPFDAIVLERMGQVGELASPSAPLMRILDAREREVSAKLQEQQVDSIRDVKTITLEVRGRSYPLQLRAITPNIDTRERTQEVRLLFSGEKALPGTAGDIVWHSQQAHLPAELLVQRNDTLGVFVVNKAKGRSVARFHVLKGAVEGRPAVSDLPANALVITQGRFRLQPGDVVMLR